MMMKDTILNNDKDTVATATITEHDDDTTVLTELT